MVVDFSISYQCYLKVILVMIEGLLSFLREVLDSKSMEANDGGRVQMNNRVIRTSWLQSFKTNDLFRS